MVAEPFIALHVAVRIASSLESSSQPVGARITAPAGAVAVPAVDRRERRQRVARGVGDDAVVLPDQPRRTGRLTPDTGQLTDPRVPLAKPLRGRTPYGGG